MKTALAIVGGIAAGAVVVGGAWWLLERRDQVVASAPTPPIPTYNPAGINGPQPQQTSWAQDFNTFANGFNTILGGAQSVGWF